MSLPPPGGHGLAYTSVGAGRPTVVFLHGLFGQGRNWSGIAKSLPTRSLLVDLPNHGRSVRTTSVSYPQMAAAVAGLIRDEAGEPVILVGHSMGGKVAMSVALGHPELVAALAVVDIAPVAYLSSETFARYIAAMRAVDVAALTERGTADAALAEDVPDPAVRGFLLQSLRRADSRPGWEWQLNLDVLGASLDQVRGWPDREWAPHPGPVLWLAGADSDYVIPEYAPAMRRLFPHTRQVRVKGAGHWVHADQPGVVASAIRQLIENVRSTSAASVASTRAAG